MLGIEGQYVFDCSIDELRNFIEFDNQFLFVINEYAGNVMPDFEMAFVSKSDNLMPLLHEGTVLKTKIGRNYDSIQDLSLYVTSWDSAKHSDGFRLYKLSGFATKLSYPCNYKMGTYKSKSAIASVLEVAKKNFKQIVSNVASSKDSQNWYQPYISDREFIQKTLYRADLGDSFPMSAITMDNKFILKDVKKDLSDSGYDWKFVRHQQPKNEKDVSYNGDAVVTSNSGIINKIIGYGFNLRSLFIDAETAVEAEVKGKSVLANTPTLGGLTDVNIKNMGGIEQTENVHTNYQKSYYHNITQLLNLSRLELHLTVDAKYYEFKPLDKVMMTESSLENSKVSAEGHSGMYYISFVSRTIQARQFFTTIKINRESVNEVKDVG
jgi:hypothetical protein